MKQKTTYVCQSCSAVFARWQGQCDQCGQWNTLAEQLAPAQSSSKSGRSAKNSLLENIDKSSLILSFEHQNNLPQNWQRFSTCLTEFDRVLGSDPSGSGIVPGGVVLIGGEPGIGKSTLLSQMLVELSKKRASSSVGSSPASKKTNTISPQLSKTNSKTPHSDSANSVSNLKTPQSSSSASIAQFWYLCGEESPAQIAQRLRRLLKNQKQSETLLQELHFITTTDVDVLIQLLLDNPPQFLIVDSIQTLTTSDLLSPAGSLGQIKECTDRLTTAVKSRSIPTFLVGHVNKDGAIAGPKVLEHIVDAILELSGERGGDLRFLRATKNRFGATDEVGVFQLADDGLVEITNPSALFLEQALTDAPGSAITCLMEGTRPILTEVQALVTPSQLAMPRRVGRGIDLPRIQILSAVLQKQARLPLGVNDVFLSVVGGLQAREPAIDLALAVAIASSHYEQPVPKNSLFIGEVGLMGEIRSVANLPRRQKEARRLGYTHIYSRETHQTLKNLLRDLFPRS